MLSLLGSKREVGCTACGRTRVFCHDTASMSADDINFFPCECGAIDEKIETEKLGTA